MRMSKKKVSGILAAALAFTMVAGSLAYFTDRATYSASITTIDGSNAVNVKPVISGYSSLTEKWADANATAIASFNPGEAIDLSYTLTNSGQLAVDVRETYVVTSSVAMTDGAPEFRLFSEADKDTNNCWKGTTPVTNEVKLSETKYKYSIAPYTLDGTDEVVNEVTATSKQKTDKLIFDASSSNAFQAATVTVDYVVEIKQHTSGGDADWVTAATGTVTLGGDTYTAVPKSN